MKYEESISLFGVYGNLGDSGSICHVCRCLFRNDSMIPPKLPLIKYAPPSLLTAAFYYRTT